MPFTLDEMPDRLGKQLAFIIEIDKLKPILLNYCTEGRGCKEHHVTLDKPLGLGPNIIAKSSEALADYSRKLLYSAAELGYFHTPDDS